jgi:hypothetical protein
VQRSKLARTRFRADGFFLQLEIETRHSVEENGPRRAQPAIRKNFLPQAKPIV